MIYRYLFIMLLASMPRVACCQGPGHQQPSLEKTFGSDYYHARQWLTDNSWIRDSLQAYGVPPNEVIAIVFPELIRYSLLWDRMEVTGLTVLYIRFGKNYADFSVGHFQMKPSFVEDLEWEAPRWLADREIGRTCPGLLHGDSSAASRRQRVNQLTLVQGELQYLALFYKVCMSSFKFLPSLPVEERIRFLATAYNCGFHHSESYIREQMTKKFFPVSKGFNTVNCNYGDLSLSWWKETRDASTTIAGN